MVRAYILAFCWAFILTVAALPPRVAAQTNQQPQLVTRVTLPGSNNVKFPDVAGGGNTVHAAGSAGSGDADSALYWSKPDNATTFPNPTRLGSAEGQSDFTSSSVTVGADGTVGFAWINQEAEQLLYRQKAPGQDWGPTRTVLSGGGEFRVEVDLTITTDRAIFVVWREPDEPIHFRVSRDGGATWSATGDVSGDVGFGIPTIAAGPNGQVLVAYTQGINDTLQIFAATWNGNSFDRRQVSSGGDSAAPAATISGTGVAYVSWIGLGRGVFFAERRTDGSWPVSQLIADNRADRRTAIAADAQNNLHVFWQSSAGGGTSIFYAFRPANGNFPEQPLRVQGDGGDLFNPNGAATLAGTTTYGHGVAEFFSGSGLVTRYFLLSSVGAGGGAQAVIEGGARIVGNKQSLTVSFNNVAGNPTQVRWNWGSAPTDADNDSNGWQQFANTITVAIPAGVNTSDCIPDRLFTQVRSGAQVATATEASIIIDNVVNDAVRAFNPYSNGRIGIFTPITRTLLMDIGRGGATDGHPSYTRVPVFYLEVGGVADCSGLKEFQVSGTGGATGSPYGIVNNFFSNIVPFPNPASVVQGPTNVAVRVSDTAGNLANFTRTFTYDTVKPALAGGSLTVTTPKPNATVLATLTFSNVNVTDNLYPGGFWGVWIANSKTPISDPATNTQLIWTPLVASGGPNFTIRNWSLASGLKTEQVTPGVYYVYVRFLDGAGNPTDGVIQAQINLTTITQPRILLPLVRG